MWRNLLIVFVLLPAAIVVASALFFKLWTNFPTGKVTKTRADKEEAKRVEEARKELRRLENS